MGKKQPPRTTQNSGGPLRSGENIFTRHIGTGQHKTRWIEPENGGVTPCTRTSREASTRAKQNAGINIRRKGNTKSQRRLHRPKQSALKRRCVHKRHCRSKLDSDKDRGDNDRNKTEAGENCYRQHQGGRETTKSGRYTEGRHRQTPTKTSSAAPDIIRKQINEEIKSESKNIREKRRKKEDE